MFGCYGKSNQRQTQAEEKIDIAEKEMIIETQVEWYCHGKIPFVHSEENKKSVYPEIKEKKHQEQKNFSGNHDGDYEAETADGNGADKIRRNIMVDLEKISERIPVKKIFVKDESLI